MVSDSTERQKRTVVIASAAGVVLVAAIAAATVGVLSGSKDDTAADAGAEAPAAAQQNDEQTTNAEDAVDPSQNSSRRLAQGSVLPEPMGGQAAIDALGDNLEVVAQRSGKTTDELEALLLRDSTLRVSTSGFLYYVDTATPPARSN